MFWLADIPFHSPFQRLDTLKLYVVQRTSICVSKTLINYKRAICSVTIISMRAKNVRREVTHP